MALTTSSTARRTRQALGLIIVSALASSPLIANASETPFQKGTWDLSVSLDANLSSVDTEISPLLGYFFTDTTEGIVFFDYSQSTGDPGNSTPKVKVRNMGFGVGIRLNLPTGQAVTPYLQAAYSYEMTSTENGATKTEDLNGWELDGEIGLRWLVNEKGAVSLGLRAGLGTVNNDISNTSMDVTGWGATLGYSIFIY